MEEDYYQKQFKVSLQEWAFVGYNKTSRCPWSQYLKLIILFTSSCKMYRSISSNYNEEFTGKLNDKQHIFSKRMYCR